MVTIDAGFLQILVDRLKSCNHELALFIYLFGLFVGFFCLVACLFFLVYYS